MPFQIQIRALLGAIIAEIACVAAAQTPTADALRMLDAELNRVYQAALQASTDGTARADVKASQRRWVQARNDLCEISSRDAAAPDWPGNLQAAKGDCIARVTRDRIAALAQLRPVTRGTITGFTDHDRLVPVSSYTFPVGHTSGKWYAEIEINRDVLAGQGDLEMQAGLDNIDGFLAITGSARTMPAHADVEVYGLAVDLNKHELYWRNAAGPGPANGQPLAVGTKPWALKVRMNTNLQYLLSRGQVRINHGQRPFSYPMPAGYKAWYAPTEADEPSRWLQPPYERALDLERAVMARQYWDWLTDRDPSQNATRDRSGALCGLNQDPKFWFLAGAAAEDRIERRCTVPAGMPLVVPVMAMLLQFDKTEDCEANAKLASLAPYTLQNTFLEVDGKRFDRLQDYSASWSACTPFEIRGKRTGKQAIWLGLWVPLRPLPRGDHVISFGGRFNALNSDRQVTYRISVQ